MKILFLSDIHGIVKNLSSIQKLEAKENFDKIVVLGDLYHTDHQCQKILEIDSDQVQSLLMSFRHKLVCLKGNCDSNLDIKTTKFPICSNLALICVDHLNIYLTHGHEYNKYHHPEFSQNSILVYGHEHFPSMERIDDILYICVGSLSLPRYGSKASYMIYENRIFTIYSIDQEVIDQIQVN
ncbi:MAG: phosphodiesterase [bacterium]|nr:phosphodiesterase [bacterium]